MAAGHKKTWSLIKRIVPAPLFNLASRLLPRPLKRLLSGAVDYAAGAAVERTLQERSAQKVAATRRRITASELEAHLRAIDFGSEPLVMVHSSLKALGFVEGGPSAVVSALTGVLVTEAGGTVAMPAISVQGTMYASLQAGTPFDARATPSGVGAITEVFRQTDGVRRSVHPTHSVCALGPRADWLVEAHHRCGSTFGKGSPYARLVEGDGWLCGLGVDLGPVTFYHVLEDTTEAFPFPVYTRDSPFTVRCIDDAGEEHALSVMAHDPAVSVSRIDTPNGLWIRRYITRVLEDEGVLTWHRVGDGKAWRIRASQMLAQLERLMERGVTIYSTAEQVRLIDHTRAADIDKELG